MAEEAMLPAPTRYITDNDDKGGSFFSAVLPDAVPATLPLQGAKAYLAYTTGAGSAQLSGAADVAEYQAAVAKSDPPHPLVREGPGMNVWYVDTPPGGTSPMHRTLTLDMVVLIEGELELTLSSGESRLVRRGDLIVQRATLHKWHNPSKTQWSRLCAVMSHIEPVVTKSAGELQQEFHD